MDSIPAGAHRVKCENTHSHPYSLELSAQFEPGQRYTIPGVNHPNGRPKILLVEDLRTRIGRNVRTSDAVHYTANTLNIRCDVLEKAISRGLLWIEIAIDYRRTGTRKIFAASVDTILTQSEKIHLDGCDQWALPKHIWLCDGKPQPQPQPEADQPMLFDMPAERRGGGY